MSPLRRFLKLLDLWTLQWIIQKNTRFVFFPLKDMKVLKKNHLNVRTSCCNVNSCCEFLLLTAFPAAFPPDQYIWRWDLSRSRGKPQQREVKRRTKKKIRQSGATIHYQPKQWTPLYGKSCKITSLYHLYCLIPPQAGNLMMPVNLSAVFQDKVWHRWMAHTVDFPPKA